MRSAADRTRSSRPSFRPVALLLCAALAACQALEDAAKSLAPNEKPTASIADAHLVDLSLDAVTLVLDVLVDNPYTASLPLSRLGYTIRSGDRTLLSGTTSPGAPIAASSASSIPLSVTIPFGTVLATLSGVRPGSVVDWAAALELTVDAPLIGPLTLPLEREGQLPIPAVPDVSLASVHWDELTLGQARATLALDVRNTNSFAIELEDLSLGVSLGGTHVADASAVPLDSLAGGESARVNIPISFSPMSLGTAALSLFKGEASSYGLDGLLSLGTPFGPLATPVTRTGTVPFLR